MNHEQHLHNIHSLGTNRAKLEYCLDNGIYAATCHPDILEVLEDIRDEVRGRDSNTEESVEAIHEYSDAVVATERVRPNRVLGMDRRPLKEIPGYEIDNLGNVFNRWGQIAYTKFIIKAGGLLIRNGSADAQGHRPYYLVARLMLSTFSDEELPEIYHVKYRDRDMSNCNINNLYWVSA